MLTTVTRLYHTCTPHSTTLLYTRLNARRDGATTNGCRKLSPPPERRPLHYMSANLVQYDVVHLVQNCMHLPLEWRRALISRDFLMIVRLCLEPLGYLPELATPFPGNTSTSQLFTYSLPGILPRFLLQIPCNTRVPLGLPWTVTLTLQCNVTFMPVTAHGFQGHVLN